MENIHSSTEFSKLTSPRPWLLERKSNVSNPLKTAPSDSHIVLFVLGCDGAYAQREAWRDLYTRAGSKNITVIFAEPLNRVMEEDMIGWTK